MIHFLLLIKMIRFFIRFSSYDIQWNTAHTVLPCIWNILNELGSSNFLLDICVFCFHVQVALSDQHCHIACRFLLDMISFFVRALRSRFPLPVRALCSPLVLPAPHSRSPLSTRTPRSLLAIPTHAPSSPLTLPALHLRSPLALPALRSRSLLMLPVLHLRSKLSIRPLRSLSAPRSLLALPALRSTRWTICTYNKTPTFDG